MQRVARRNLIAARRPVVVATAVAVVAVIAVVVVNRALAPAGPDPTVLYGRWVKSGEACDGPYPFDVVITPGPVTEPVAAPAAAGKIVTHGGSRGITSQLKVAAVRPAAAPGTLEMKYETFDGVITGFVTFQVKDATTLVATPYLMMSEGVWRKCPAS